MGEENMNIKLKKFSRQTNFEKIQFLNIDKYKGKTTKLISKYSGYIGLLPHTSREGDEIKDSNFLYSMWRKKFIDHMVVSFFVQNDSTKKSTIKFGSYDQIGLMPGKEL